MGAERTFKNIALIGFMGAGKSSVGRQVASLLEFGFADTDDLIEAKAGQTITDIFANQGEEAFRKIESEVIGELSGHGSMVISTGGGVGANEDHLNSLKTHSLVICLWASPEVIWKRVRHQSHRPLLQNKDPQAKIKELLELREPIYRQADVLVHSDLRPIREIAQQITHQFQIAKQSAS